MQLSAALEFAMEAPQLVVYHHKLWKYAASSGVPPDDAACALLFACALLLRSKIKEVSFFWLWITNAGVQLVDHQKYAADMPQVVSCCYAANEKKYSFFWLWITNAANEMMLSF